MIYFFLGLGLLALLLYGAKIFTQADPKSLAKYTRLFGGIASLALAIVFALRGGIFIASLLGGWPLRVENCTVCCTRSENQAWSHDRAE